MIIKSIKIENWRSINKLELNFIQDKVNIIYGPNEIGKSTIREAIYFAFIKEYNSASGEIDAVVPVGKNVGPYVKLDFLVNNKIYSIEKKFLTASYACLYENKELIAEDKGVKRKILELLGIKENQIPFLEFLWVKQGTILDIINIKNERNSISNLIKEILISEFSKNNKNNEEFYKKINEDLKKYITEGGRIKTSYDSIINILEKRKIEFENKINEFNKRIENINSIENDINKIKEKIEYYRSNLREKEKILQKFEINREKLRDFDTKKIKYENIKKEYEFFLKNENDIQNLEKQELELLKIKKLLLSKKIAKYNEIMQKLENLNKEFFLLPNVSKDELKELKEKQQENEKLNIILEANKIRLEINPFKVPLNFKIKSDLEEEKSYGIKERINFQANKIIKFRTEEYEINITSSLSEERFKEITEKIDFNLNFINESLKKYNIKNLSELEYIFNKREEFLLQKKQLEQESKNFNYEKLENEYNKFKNIEIDNNIFTDFNNIELNQIEEKLIRIRTSIENKKSENKRILNNRIKEDFEKDFFLIKKDFEIHSSEIYELVPQNITNYLKNIEKIKEDINKINSEILENEKNKIQKETELKNIESIISEKNRFEEELLKVLKELEKEYINYYSLLLLKNIIEKSKKNEEDNIFIPLQKRISDYFKNITESYTYINFLSKDLKFNEEIEKIDNNKNLDNTFLFSSLSYGTKEQLAFLFRFVLAEKISEKESLPLILDDTLVNSDFNRFSKIINLIKKMKNKISCLIFTCNINNYSFYLNDNENFYFIDLTQILKN